VRNDIVGASVGVLVFLVLLPASAWAQGETGTIAGVVKDTTGAVMPGVTVEASSPALIEKVRVVTTDAQGQYKVIDLRTGTYTVTFTLTGFNTLRREGIELSAGFTATVNGDLRVGSLEETITVSGQAPVVDVQNVLQQKVMTRDIMDSLPTAKTFGSYAILVPGVTVSAPDVGGAYGDLSVSLSIHGSRMNESQIDVDGMPVIISTHNRTWFRASRPSRSSRRISPTVPTTALHTGSIAATSTTIAPRRPMSPGPMPSRRDSFSCTRGATRPMNRPIR